MQRENTMVSDRTRRPDREVLRDQSVALLHALLDSAADRMDERVRAITAIVACAVLGGVVVVAFLVPGRGSRELVILSSLIVPALAALTGKLHRRASRVDAALWIERRVRLDQRLVTLAAARPEDAASPLWPELVADNLSHLVSWQEARTKGWSTSFASGLFYLMLLLGSALAVSV